MKLSRRARRMKRHYSRMHQTGGLNLVSLMDIFTILVFFLMVNSSDVKVLQTDNLLELPVSIADQYPKDNLVITVSENNILVQGRSVAIIDDAQEGEIIQGLKAELEYQSKRAVAQIDEDFKGYPVTLIADKRTPYRWLKKIMATCTDAQYTQISLAVSKKTLSKDA